MIFSAILFLDGSGELVEEPLGFIAVSSGLVQRPRHFQQRVVHSCLLLYDYRWSICWSTSGGPSLFFYQKFFLLLLLKEESVGGGMIIHSGPLN